MSTPICAHCATSEGVNDRIDSDLATFLLCDACWTEFLEQVASDYGMVAA